MTVMLIRKLTKLENRDTKIKWMEEISMTAQSKNGAKVGLISDGLKNAWTLGGEPRTLTNNYSFKTPPCEV